MMKFDSCRRIFFSKPALLTFHCFDSKLIIKAHFYSIKDHRQILEKLYYLFKKGKSV